MRRGRRTVSCPASARSPAQYADLDDPSVTSEHTLLAGRLEWDRRDPVDRLLVARAVVENATLVTPDAAIRRFERAAGLGR